MTKLFGLRTRRGRLLGVWAKDAPEAPPAPDFEAAARATAAGNLANSEAALRNNRITQNTPFGSISYTRDKDGNWTQSLNYSPQQQKLLDAQNAASLGMARQIGLYMNQLKGSMYADAGKVGQDALMARYQPQIMQDRAALETQLANQGIMAGSEAYTNAMRMQNQQENDLYRQAALYGQNEGRAMQGHYMGLLGNVRQQSAPTAPNFAPVPQQQVVGGPDLLGATQSAGNYAQGLYNAQVGQYNADGGWFGPVGSAALNLGTSYAMGKAMSDIRLKKDIQQIGATDKGLPVYVFRYLWDRDDESPRVGVMAQDVLKVMPDAVSERDGYLMVDYARI